MKSILPLIFFAFIIQLSNAQTYTNAESVEYDPVNDQWLVSNGSRMIADDGNGNLTFFGTGPAQLGLEVLGNTAFVSVADGVKGYDLTTENEVMDVSVPGATFLNGMTNDGNNTLYATGFSSNKIFAIDVSDLNNPVVTEIVSNTGQQPNGIVYDGANNRLLFVTWTNPALVKAVDLTNNMVSDVTTTNVGQIDGIDDDSQGNYYVSSWSPDRITKYNSDFSVSEVVTTPAINSPADIGINQATNTLAIPIFSDVIFVDLQVLSVEDLTQDAHAFGVSSNPIQQHSYAQFTTDGSQEASLTLYDVRGVKVTDLFYNPNPNGIQKVLFAGIEIPKGVYFLQLKIGNKYQKTLQVIF